LRFSAACGPVARPPGRSLRNAPLSTFRPRPLALDHGRALRAGGGVSQTGPRAPTVPLGLVLLAQAGTCGTYGGGALRQGRTTCAGR
jgi:hypothetical protein